MMAWLWSCSIGVRSGPASFIAADITAQNLVLVGGCSAEFHTSPQNWLLLICLWE